MCPKITLQKLCFIILIIILSQYRIFGPHIYICRLWCSPLCSRNSTNGQWFAGCLVKPVARVRLTCTTYRYNKHKLVWIKLFSQPVSRYQQLFAQDKKKKKKSYCIFSIVNLYQSVVERWTVVRGVKGSIPVYGI